VARALAERRERVAAWEKVEASVRRGMMAAGR
jgi:hypothetical protein